MVADVYTLLLMMVCASLTMGFALAFVAWGTPMRDLGLWAVALLTHAVAISLFALRGRIPDWVSIVVANALLSLTYGLLLLAIVLFLRQSQRYFAAFVPPLLTAVVFVLLLDNFAARYVAAGAIFSTQLFYIMWVLWSHRKDIVGRGGLLVALGIGVVTVIYLQRLLQGLFEGSEVLPFLTPNVGLTASYVSGFVASVLASTGFLLMIRERDAAVLAQLAIHDGLTGLANRRHFDQVLANECLRLRRTGEPLSLLMIDIDHFKQINDQFGHAVGDQCLQRVAAVIADLVTRAPDLAARYGGEEFICLLPGTHQSGALQIAEQLRAQVAACDQGAGCQHLTVSIGVMTADVRLIEQPNHLLICADAALYCAKANGRNRVELAPESLAQGHFVPWMKLLVWRDAYAVGDTQVDAEHRQLFVRANELLDALTGKRSLIECQQLFGLLLDEVAEHFVNEEQIARQAGCTEVDVHAQIHRDLLEKTRFLGGKLAEDQLTLSEAFSFAAHDLVAGHILGEDRKLFQTRGNRGGEVRITAGEA